MPGISLERKNLQIPGRRKRKKYHHRSLISSDCTSSSCSQHNIHKKRKHNHCSSPTSIHLSVSNLTNPQTITTYRQSTITPFLTNVISLQSTNQQIRTPPRPHQQPPPSPLAPATLQHSPPLVPTAPSPCLQPEPAHKELSPSHPPGFTDVNSAALDSPSSPESSNKSSFPDPLPAPPLPEPPDSAIPVLTTANPERQPIISPKDAEDFGDTFPTQWNSSLMTITFQNVGPQPQYLSNDKVKSNTAASHRLHPDIALFAKHDLNPSKLKCGNTFSDRQSTAIPGTTSYLVNNCHESEHHAYSQWGGYHFLCVSNL